ncbi:DUF3500 domain-containing protein [Flavobacterium sp. SUN052]|uniref:DUF3500 domain-containing protein n=1 Tax=Flavobacterium sp. SUN052 TaxID=3002441 RepID=UPI00237DCD71|nr:DUF3500 domain-containing protein [Flavobacterium sp. SUN052]MEC4004530.1 DUF3500 domain-containing protein [Flavobacterium sp. SUN052]
MRIISNTLFITTISLFLFFGLLSDDTNKVEISKFKPKSTLNTTVTTQNIIDLANTFKATLSSSQITTLQLNYTLSNAETWSNLPAAMSARLGLRLGTLTTAQLTAARNLVQAITGTGNEGYNEVYGLWMADDFLVASGASSSQYGAGQFYIGFFGTPSLTGTFEIQMTGHHRTVANTYINGALVGATPSFVAVEPYAAFTQGGTTYQPMIEEKTALVNMLAGLTTTQLATAHLSTTISDLVCGPHVDWSFPTTKSGLIASGLTTAQKQLIIDAIATYVNDVDDVNAATILAQYTSEIDQTYICWGTDSTLNAQNGYVRIDGPSVWIEYSTQNGIILTPKHPHSIWRDHSKDYGGTGNLKTDSFSAVSKIMNFPNPVDQSTTFSFNLKEDAKIKINIYDMNGKLVKTPYNSSLSIGNNSITTDLSNLESGNYLYSIEANGVKSTSNKLVKK